MNERLQSIIETLQELSGDNTVPRNVKTIFRDIVELLQKEDEEISIRKDKALSLLDDIGEDSNLQAYTRTQIWNVVSALEML